MELKMASEVKDALIVVCPSCIAANRVPAGKLHAGGTCGRCKQPLFIGEPVTLTSTNFDAHVRRAGTPMLVDFWAPWCGPCRQMAPAFTAAAKKLEPEIRLGKLNTEVEQAIAGRFDIRSIPTLILFSKGIEIARKSGAMPESAIVDWARRSLPA